MIRFCSRTALGWAFVAALASAAPAAEPWTDPHLPVRESLEIWLDASRLGPTPDANAAADHIAHWADGSGHGRHFSQPAASQQPRRSVEAAAVAGERSAGETEDQRESACVVFDGADDWLGWSAPLPGVQFESLTVLMVAAPRSNLGGYRALVSASARNTNDYVTGFNVDLGQAGRGAFDWLNVEGAGFSGERDLLGRTLELGACHLFALTIGRERVQLRVDGQPAGERPRQPGAIGADDIRLGARWYDNSQPSPGPHISGLLDGSLAELLWFGRELEAVDLAQLEHYLATKHARLLNRPPPLAPQVVQFLTPGFEVRELPLALTNVNALQYDDRGRLFALGYDGRVRVLTDTDSDGLEDAVHDFFDSSPVLQPLSMLVTPSGVYVAGGKAITKFIDDDGDARADRREVVIQDWTPSTNYSGGVDSLGLAMDAAGTLYFGLGCDDFTNAYRLVDGKSLYSLANARGTIQKIAPGATQSETVCSGIRFPVGLALNAAGDLFCTDQEGETWLPGGNPLDELNHIVPGRHYGFPPRSDEHLPHVNDEPPVVAFGPQHQSTCGLKFNDVRWGQQPFGPAPWHGNALVAGYSRGKLWRAELVQTASGYIGRETLIASCRMLLVDVAVSPQGHLLLACHGGAPDWGTGPQGKGRLFQVRYHRRDQPQSVLAWAASALETHIAFDRPLDDAWRQAALGATIEYGQHVRAADRLEALRPGYDSVRRQLESPRQNLRVADAKLSADRRELILRTDPHPAHANYAVRLPTPPLSTAHKATADATPTEIDLAYTLHGVEAAWTPSGAAAAGHKPLPVWLPHLDTAAAAGLTRSSAAHERWFESLKTPGELTLQTRLSLPTGKHRLELETNAATCTVTVASEDPLPRLPGKENRFGGLIESHGQPLSLRIVASQSTATTGLTLAVRTRLESDPNFHPLPLSALLLPWAPSELPAPSAAAGPAPQLAGGDWDRGRKLFFSSEAKCSACHTLRGEGTKIGPDLTNLVHRDPESVLRDVTQPSAAINPEFVPYALHLSDGRTLTGLVRAEADGQLRVTNGDAQQQVVAANDVERLEASTKSIMPDGISDKLGPQGVRDLLTFLLLPPATPSEPVGVTSPPQRTPAELAAVRRVPVSETPSAAPKPLKLLLVWGHKDHGPGEHDYPRWRAEWSERLASVPGVSVRTALNWPTPDQWGSADAVVLYHFHQDYSPARLAELDAFLARGGGVTALHSAVVSAEPEALAERLGLAAKVGPTKYRHGPTELTFTGNALPFAGELSLLKLVDETYWPLLGDPSRVQILATAHEEDRAWPMLWTYDRSPGRVFGCIMGHYYWTLDDPVFRAIWLRGLAWSAAAPPDRFDSLLPSR